MSQFSTKSYFDFSVFSFPWKEETCLLFYFYASTEILVILIKRKIKGYTSKTLGGSFERLVQPFTWTGTVAATATGTLSWQCVLSWEWLFGSLLETRQKYTEEHDGWQCICHLKLAILSAFAFGAAIPGFRSWGTYGVVLRREEPLHLGEIDIPVERKRDASSRRGLHFAFWMWTGRERRGQYALHLQTLKGNMWTYIIIWESYNPDSIQTVA